MQHSRRYLRQGLPLDRPAPRKIAPLYQPLGYFMIAREPRYVVQIGDKVGHYRAGEMMSLHWLIGTVYPYAEYWRHLFPLGRKSIDAKQAASWFIRQCRAAGPIQPPPLPSRTSRAPD